MWWWSFLYFIKKESRNKSVKSYTKHAIFFFISKSYKYCKIQVMMGFLYFIKKNLEIKVRRILINEDPGITVK